jgi:hypothetical protein
VAVNTVYHDRLRPSHIALPLKVPGPEGHRPAPNSR